MSSPPGWWSSRGWQACLLYPLSRLVGLIVWWRRRQAVRAAGRINRQTSVRHAPVPAVPPPLADHSGNGRSADSAAAGTDSSRSSHGDRTDPETADVPVIVVGNLSVGGTGKSPLVAHLALRLQRQGYRVGIVSRGYGGVPQRRPLQVSGDSDPALAGDEAVMHARLTGVPVCVCTERSLAVACLVGKSAVDVILSDDGLQHYAMARAAEIVVVDGQRGFGNGWLLPAGPLREPVSRLLTVDLVAVQSGVAAQRPPAGSDRPAPAPTATGCSPGGAIRAAGYRGDCGEFTLQIDSLFHLGSRSSRRLDTLPAGQQVHAVTGLGNPQRFFDSLAACGLSVIPHAFADHHRFSAAEIGFGDGLPVLVTSKDAVKIERLQVDLDLVYEVRVVLQADGGLQNGIERLLQTLLLTADRTSPIQSNMAN